MRDDAVARYSFLPWLRQGIANTMRTATRLRVSVPLDVELATDDSGLTATVTREVQLYGPGDITGLNSDAIIRTEPRNWITDFEPNYFPFVEFYEEDLLWRYTPQTATEASNRLTPWMALVVLTEDEFSDYIVSADAPVTAIQVENATSVFPAHDQLFAWAHIHVNEDLTDEGARSEDEAVSYLADQLENNPDLAYCRLMCPRKLETNTAYHAFVIPAFEIGRKTGLGLELDESVDTATASAWGTSDQEVFPVYYRWYFRTGQTGDFEYLVRQLEPRVMPPAVGIRDMDVQDPGSGLEGIDIEKGILGLEGALISPQAERTEWPGATDPDTWQLEMFERVNLAETYKDTDGSFEGDPIVTSPLYARWHALVSRLAAGTVNCVHELNLDPRHRVGSGFGTRVVQTHQEKYVNEAWNQVGDVLEANQRIQRAQLSKFGSFALYERNLVPLSESACLSLTGAVHKRILSSPTIETSGTRITVTRSIANSSLPAAVLSPALRKIARPRGPVVRAVDGGGDRKAADIPARMNAGEITATPPKTAPESTLKLDDVATEFQPTPTTEWLLDFVENRLRRYLPLIVAIGLILFVALWLIAGYSATVLLPTAAAGLFYARSFLRKMRAQGAPYSTLQEDNLTVEAVEELPEAPGFQIVPAGTAIESSPGTGGDSVEAANFKKALTDLHVVFEEQAAIEQAARPALDLGAVREDVLRTLNPLSAIPQRTVARLGLSAQGQGRLLHSFKPVMAYPEFPYPMYEPLRDISAELLVPNVNQVKQNTISLLETNQKFIESYMVGLNHEMGRELLWREYPTDQRGSYFRQFWDVSDYVNTDLTLTNEELEERLKDIPPIHEWTRDSELGDHNNREDGGDEEQLVLVVRGDLLKRYPNTVVYAQHAQWQRDRNGSIDRSLARTLDSTGGQERYPLYSARIEPDIAFLGFDLTADEVRGGTGDESDDDPGWYFVLKERPGEPRFGLDNETSDTPATAREWDELAWNHVTVTNGHARIDDEIRAAVSSTDNPEGVAWGSGSQAHDIAYITYQDPVLVAVHGAKMLA